MLAIERDRGNPSPSVRQRSGRAGCTSRNRRSRGVQSVGQEKPGRGMMGDLSIR
jgi:hypothetical protein